MENKECDFNFFKPGQGSGDCGMTDLLGGRRVPKTHCLIKLNALLDDLNACLGLMKTEKCSNGTFPFCDETEEIQKMILKISAKTAGMNADLSPLAGILEEKTLSLNKKHCPPKDFILPGANRAESLCHCARTKTRLCEIAAWEAGEKETAKILNRMSDYFFIMCIALRK